MAIRTLIVDDEPLAREGLMLLLKDEPDIEVVQECGNGRDAIETILKLKPDLVLLDIEMPRFNGFDVIRSIAPELLPFVIFITAYDKYAVEAFNIHAIDYLLKPVRKSRLQESLTRVRDKMLHRNMRENGEKLGALLHQLSQGVLPSTVVEKSVAAREDDRIIVRAHGHVYFLQTRNILWVEAEGDYVTIHTPQKSHLLRETMRNMEKRLEDHGFKRIHRSAIINLRCVSELTSNRNNDYNVVLTDGTVLSLGRSYKDSLYASLGSSEPD